MIFTGTFHRCLDSKLRVLLPKRLRDGLSEKPGRETSDLLASVSGGVERAAQGASEDGKLGAESQVSWTTELYLTPGTDSCLELHTTESLNELARQTRLSRSGSQNRRSFARLFYARAEHCEIDGHGRIRIPKELAELANLTKEIVIVGVGFHWEVWDLPTWNEFLEGNNDQFDAIVQSTFDVPPDQIGSHQESAGAFAGIHPDDDAVQNLDLQTSAESKDSTSGRRPR